VVARPDHAGRASRLAAARFTLPVSGVAVTLREPTGVEDLLLAERPAADPAVVLRLVERLGEADADLAWGDFTVTDIDALILRLRQWMLGDRVSANLPCAAPDCGSRVELSFGVDSYLSHHRPHRGPLSGRGWTVTPADRGGWYAFAGQGAPQPRFRLPTLNDQIAVAGAGDPARALASRCVEPDPLPRRLAARVESAMAAYAPALAGPLHGACPECGAPVVARFEARAYCLQELGDRARFVFDDVDALAERYHWSERAILTMPYARRVQYAERARQSRTA